MAQHRWHKEIKAWADGAEIEARWNSKMSHVKHDWYDCDGKIDWDLPASDFRIKPQPKEPQYLYVYKGAISHEPIITFGKSNDPLVETNFVAKIKLEVDDNGNN
jgi:hypothetical protein